jgi:Ca-activated chloride channel family protein
MNIYPEPQTHRPALQCIAPERLAPVLETVLVNAVLEDLLGQTEVRQSFRNRDGEPIEAVYTFPVPVGAVLLGFTARIGKRDLVGRILPAAQAENDYEEAVTDGDAAILLQEAGPGLYTVNVGNLLPGERIELCYRYAQLQYWAGDTLRFAMPTVIAPRYGDPAATGMQGHQVPFTDVMADQSISIRVAVRGRLQQAEITCPTHEIQIDRTAGEAAVSFAGLDEQSMDRDIILNLRRRPGRDAGSVLLDSVPGSEFVTGLLTICPAIDAPVAPAPRFVKVLVDCSGSMQGDSIRQAREALMRILDSLRPQDWFTIVAFGSTHRFVTPPSQKADAPALKQARAAVKSVHADLGGTELRSALQAITALKAPTGHGTEFHGTEPVPGDILLITDGELFDTELVDEARRKGDRVFTVGVGCAPGESLLGALSEATGGAAEFVTPTDDMAGRIHRHFQRLYQPRLHNLRIDWPGQVMLERRDRQGGIFAGDTIHVLARYSTFDCNKYSERGAPRARDRETAVHIAWTTEDGRECRQTVAPERRADDSGGVAAADLLDRLLVAGAIQDARYAKPDASLTKHLTDEALRCQLMSPWTSCLVVAERTEGQKTDGQPKLRQVGQMMAAGSHGFGSVHHLALQCRTACFMEADHAAEPDELASIMSGTDWADDRTFTFNYLAALGVPDALVAELRRLVDAGADENEVCLLCLHAMLKARRKLAGMDRDEARKVRQSAKSLGVDAALVRRVEALVKQWG